jgi:hypothetical protein
MTLDDERDRGVDVVLSDLVVLDNRHPAVDLDLLDVVDGLGGSLQRFLDGVIEALCRPGDDPDHLDDG